METISATFAMNAEKIHSVLYKEILAEGEAPKVAGSIYFSKRLVGLLNFPKELVVTVTEE